MQLKMALIFTVSILIPTAFLAYFGLGAVRSEQAIVERNIKERYKAMADVVEGGIRSTLADMPEELSGNRQYLESVLLGETTIFKDEVRIFNREGKKIKGPGRSFADAGRKETLAEADFSRPISGFPYTIAVYERHPALLAKLEQKKKGLYLYIALIGTSAFAILCGGFFTLRALTREWRMAELKAEFVMHLSHDLRRPLTSIRMFAEMLKDGRVPSEEQKSHYYGIISDESERLAHLANNILDFSRIEMGRKRYDLKEENITTLVKSAVEQFKSRMRDEKRRVSLNIEEGIPPVKLDATAVSQALVNLLANAAKFSPAEREITVNLLRRRNDDVIEVIDGGIGIPRAEQKKVFRKFYRTAQKQTTETEGTGLGLTLVKYTALAHGGRVEIESEEGKGSKFSLILPA